ncbi:hypothetical protein RRG08_007273 [Elysia crispata]|uniref:Saposin B-type domain-containing protein n=1 Tax=Elysia crispata TaxID=231223 RepID=A0AAE1DLC4_9GAST|nr:hypothetical protein RRG08_007273 [Elysia crispata]
MKKIAILVICSLMSVSLGLPNVQHVFRRQTKLKSLEHKVSRVNKVNADLCPLCIQFTGQAINQLLNIILNMGVVGTCGQLCQLLAEKTGSQLLGAACTILCDIEGVQEFVKLIQEADLDPIYLCELLKTCPVFDGGDATITKISVTPQSGPQGEREIMFTYASKNGTGTGEIIVGVDTVDGIPVESGFLQEPLAAGNYNKTLTLKAEPDPDCDPTQQPCEMWYPGNYTVIIDICNGECGSKHPHSKVYDRKTANFTIVNGMN